MNKIPSFSSPNCPIDESLPYFERGVAIIWIAQAEKFVMYDKFDGKWRFPGGHVESGEDALTAAIRETKEEVGLQNLGYNFFVGSCFKYYLFKSKPSRVLEHYYFFKTNYANWETKTPDETGMHSQLISLDEIAKQNWNQQLWALDKLQNFLN
jgi:8-oxo-dGTP pyrophosphatase MutT (NUDIX family)